MDKIGYIVSLDLAEAKLVELQSKYDGITAAYAEELIKAAEIRVELLKIANMTDSDLRNDAPRLAVRMREIAQGIIDNE